MPPSFAPGLRHIFDSHLRFFRGGLEVFLRVKNFDDAGQPYTELGFKYTPASGAQGYTDVVIAPPPDVVEVSTRNIGLSQTRLQFGAKHFLVSHSFVRDRAASLGFTDQYQVFRHGTVVGLIYNNRLYTIESVTTKDEGGEILYWDVVANASEKALT